MNPSQTYTRDQLRQRAAAERAVAEQKAASRRAGIGILLACAWRGALLVGVLAGGAYGLAWLAGTL